MEKLKQMIDESVAFIRTKTDMSPKIGIILGSGLGDLAQAVKREIEISYEHIPHFPVSTVEAEGCYSALSAAKKSWLWKDAFISTRATLSSRSHSRSGL